MKRLDKSSEDVRRGVNGSPVVKKVKKTLMQKRRERIHGTGGQLLDEVDEYASVVCVLNEKTNTLAWWAKNKARFPILFLLARQYLCIDATSCEPERIFSACGLLLSNLRSNLLPWKVEALLTLHLNKEDIHCLKTFL